MYHSKIIFLFWMLKNIWRRWNHTIWPNVVTLCNTKYKFFHRQTWKAFMYPFCLGIVVGSQWLFIHKMLPYWHSKQNWFKMNFLETQFTPSKHGTVSAKIKSTQALIEVNILTKHSQQSLPTFKTHSIKFVNIRKYKSQFS